MLRLRSVTTSIFLSCCLLEGCESDRALDPSRSSEARISSARLPGTQLAAPSNTTALPSTSNSSIGIRWDDNSSKETAFEVYRSTTGAGGVFSLVIKVGQDATSAADAAVSAGQEYCYEVRAIQVSGKTAVVSPFSNTACAMIPPPPPPAVPSSASETIVKPVSSSSVLVEWTAVGVDFRIEKSVDSGASWSVAGVANNTRYFTDWTQTEQPVCYRVVAYNLSGDAAPSNTACTIPPAAATGITATQVDAETIELNWIDNSAVEDGYEVWFGMAQFSCSGENSGSSEGDWILVALPANSTTYRTAAVLGQDLCAYHSWIEIRTLKDGGYSSSIYTIDP